MNHALGGWCRWTVEKSVGYCLHHIGLHKDQGSGALHTRSTLTIANYISDLRLDFGFLRSAGLASQFHPEVPQEHEDDPICSIEKTKFQSLLPPPRKPIIPSLTLDYLRKSCVCTDLENIYFPLDDEAMTQ